MFPNRLTQHLEETDFVSQSRVLADAPPAGAFMMAPAGLTASVGQAQLLIWAYEKAQAVAKPSWTDRDVLGNWN